MYQKMILETLALIGRATVSPRFVEAWMRLECGTLDWLSSTRWISEVKIAADCVLASAEADNEALAASMGIR